MLTTIENDYNLQMKLESIRFCSRYAQKPTDAHKHFTLSARVYLIYPRSRTNTQPDARRVRRNPRRCWTKSDPSVDVATRRFASLLFPLQASQILFQVDDSRVDWTRRRVKSIGKRRPFSFDRATYYHRLPRIL